ncbi:hypothetical protein SDJN02_14463, partial [Cucurbita argyrosperma subsp. argyrosperma]
MRRIKRYEASKSSYRILTLPMNKVQSITEYNIRLLCCCYNRANTYRPVRRTHKLKKPHETSHSNEEVDLIRKGCPNSVPFLSSATEAIRQQKMKEHSQSSHLLSAQIRINRRLG